MLQVLLKNKKEVVMFLNKNKVFKKSSEEEKFNEEDIDYLLDEDEISLEEAGFMHGYHIVS